MISGDDTGSIGELREVRIYEGCLPENRVMLSLSNGHEVNLRYADEYLEFIEHVDKCPCPHGCQEWIRVCN